MIRASLNFYLFFKQDLIYKDSFMTSEISCALSMFI